MRNYLFCTFVVSALMFIIYNVVNETPEDRERRLSGIHHKVIDGHTFIVKEGRGLYKSDTMIHSPECPKCKTH